VRSKTLLLVPAQNQRPLVRAKALLLVPAQNQRSLTPLPAAPEQKERTGPGDKSLLPEYSNTASG
jgi:hypothetical protein